MKFIQEFYEAKRPAAPLQNVSKRGDLKLYKNFQFDLKSELKRLERCGRGWKG